MVDQIKDRDGAIGELLSKLGTITIRSERYNGVEFYAAKLKTRLHSKEVDWPAYSADGVKYEPYKETGASDIEINLKAYTMTSLLGMISKAEADLSNFKLECIDPEIMRSTVARWKK